MTDELPPVPSVPKGILGQIAQRRRAIIDGQVLIVTVPRWSNPTIKIECKPVTHDILERALGTQKSQENEKDSKKRSEVDLNNNADLLLNAAIRVFAVVDDVETNLGADGDPVNFSSPDLASALGMPTGVTARAVVRALFITDADLILTADTVGKWSGYREDSVESEAAGES